MDDNLKQLSEQITSRLAQLELASKQSDEGEAALQCVTYMRQEMEEFLKVLEINRAKKKANGPKWSLEDSDVRKENFKKYQELVREKAEHTKRIIEDESQKVLNNIVNMSITLSDSSNVNSGNICNQLKRDCNLLLNIALPIHSFIDSLEDLLDDEHLNTTSNEEFHMEIQRHHALNEEQIKEYLESRISSDILGHIVHRLLSFKYPRPAPPPGLNLPWMPVMALLLGMNNAEVMGELHEALSAHQVELVLFDHALDFCIEAYRKEGPGIPLLESRDPPPCTENPPVLSAADCLLPHALVTQNSANNEPQLLEKETQTGPEVVPALSLAASLGKQALETLRLQQQLSDWLKVGILIEHLKEVSASGVSGWVLADFPSTFEQISLFESAISGQHVPNPDLKNDEENFSKVTLHQSQIVCDPSAPHSFLQPFKTTFTSVVSISEVDPPQDVQLLDYVSLVQELYIQQKVHNCFHCKNWTSENIKALVELLLTLSSATPDPKRPSFLTPQQESNNDFTDFNIRPDISLCLTSLWESLEIAYLTSLHRAFFRFRAHKQRIEKYVFTTRDQFAEFLSRPDTMQELIHEFQTNYLQIPRSKLSDPQVQIDLHAYVDTLHKSLSDMTNVRLNEAENEVKQIAGKLWLSRELGELLNLASFKIQLELDRFIDTIALLQDYFMTSLESIPPDASKSLRFDVAKALSPETTDEWASSLVETLISHSVSANLPEQFTAHLDSVFQAAKAHIEKLSGTLRTSITKLQTATKPKPAASKKKQVVKKAKGKKDAVAIDDVKSLEDIKAANLISLKLKLLDEWLTVCNSETMVTIMRLEQTCEETKSHAEDMIEQIKANVFAIARNAYEAQFNADSNSIATFSEFVHLAVKAQAKLDGPLVLPRKTLYLQYLKAPHAFTDFANPIQLDMNIMQQVKEFVDILQRVAPDGLILCPALVYILQQAASSTQTCYLPPSWHNLSSEVIADLVNTVVASFSHADWRSFLLLLLSMPIATQRELLIAKTSLEEGDKMGRGTVSRSHFCKTRLWLEQVFDHQEDIDMIKEVICDMFSKGSRDQINYLDFLIASCHDNNPAVGFAKACAVYSGCLVTTGFESNDDQGFDYLLSEINITFPVTDVIKFDTASKVLLSGAAQCLTEDERVELHQTLTRVFREVDDEALTAEQRRARQRAIATKGPSYLEELIITEVPANVLMKHPELLDLVTPMFQTFSFESMIKNVISGSV